MNEDQPDIIWARTDLGVMFALFAGELGGVHGAVAILGNNQSYRRA